MMITSLANALYPLLSEPICMENMCLPNHYADIEYLDDFQEGYRCNANTGEDLTGFQDGDWLPHYVVICQNYFLDPFIINMEEESLGFPVYYARCGAGRWDVEKIADNLQAFHKDLLLLQQYEQGDRQVFADYIAAHKDLTVGLWQELHHSLLASDQDDSIEQQVVQKQHWIYGRVVLTEVGTNKLKIVSFLKQHFQWTGQQALQQINQLPIEIIEGTVQYCQHSLKYLQSLGATAVFIPNAPINIHP